MTSKWNHEDIKLHLEEFYNVYNNRPIKDNSGGMKSPHMFPAWYVLKKIQPKCIIESGVWKGLGTWLFEQACPNLEKIYSIDPSPHFRNYTSSKAEYQKNDFLDTDWSSLNKNETLVFFDDHQDCLPRIKKCLELGFKNIIVEDNYPYQQGDCYTPKKILSKRNYCIDKDGYKETHSHKEEDYNFLEKNIENYQELPPIFKPDLTRWGDSWDENYPTPDALLKEISKHEYSVFWKEKLDYTWICYIKLK